MKLYLHELPDFTPNKSNGASYCEDIPPHKKKYCCKAFSLLDVEVDFLKLSGEEVSLHEWDTSSTESINHDPYYYPSAQCRLDTLKLGVLGKKRPKCWYP